METFNDGVIDLSQFRKQKEQEELESVGPYFDKPMMITLGDPEEPETQLRYLLLVNLVNDGRQYLALESFQEEDKGEVIIVEADIVDDEFQGVKVVESEELYEELTGIMLKAMELQEEVHQEEKEDSDDN